MKSPLTKVQANELHALAKKINAREETIQQLRVKTNDNARATVAEAILQGQDLIAAKEKLPHGMWCDWLKAQCPGIHERMARRYMQVAERAGNGHVSDSIRGYLAIANEDEEGDKDGGKPKVYLPYMQSLYLATRFVKYVGAHPIKDCPEETRDELRKELKPIVAELWPDRFPL